MARLVIYGAGGQGRELLRIARQSYERVVFADDELREPVLGTPVIAPGQIEPDDELVVAIANSETRRRIMEGLSHLPLASLFAPTAIIGDEVDIGAGAVFCDFTAVTASARIGRGFHCNGYSYVAHDCVVGDYVTFGPRVSCNGNVHIGDGAHLAAGVIVRNGLPERPLRIGAGAFIGMGVVVTRDVPPGVKLISHQGRVMQFAGSEPVPMLGTVR